MQTALSTCLWGLLLLGTTLVAGHDRKLQQGLLGALFPNAQTPPFPGLPPTPLPFPAPPIGGPGIPLPTPPPGGPSIPIPGPGTPIPGTGVQDTGAASPTTKTGAPWDFSASGDVRTAAGSIWGQLSNDPKKVLEVAFRHFAFQINSLPSINQILLNSGRDITMKPVRKSETGRFWIFEIQSHSLEIFNVGNRFVNIKDTEIYFQISGTSSAKITIGAKTTVTPQGVVQSQINFFLEGFLEDLVDNYKMQYGAGGCEPTNREASGVCNNPKSWGAANIALRRIARNDPAFSDGTNSPSGPTDISARLISNICGTQGTTADDATNKLRLTDAFVFFGQFLDHDVGISPVGAFAAGVQPLFSVSAELFNEQMPIKVPANDPVFTGPNRKEFLPFERTVFRKEGGIEVKPRQLLNSITSFLDLSQVYGSDAVRRKALRSFQGGKLKTSSGNFLPFNGAGSGGVGISLENAPNAQSRFYVAGDIRVCENANLAALHTLFLREHNLVADEISRVMPGLSDETLFRYARDVVIAEYQSIIYAEWLPKLLGSGAPNPNSYGYNSNVDPSMDAFFTTVAFRFGHTMVNNFLWKMNAGSPTPYERVPLRNVFFEPEEITPGTIDDFVRGMSKHQARDVDMKVVDDLRSFLFTEGGPSMDLLALNIQRGRDIGLPSYNSARAAFNLPAATSFAAITSNAQWQAQLSLAYNGNVNLVDPFIGGLAENAPASRLFGDLFQASLASQFRRLRDGDRFFYKGFPFPNELVSKYSRINSIKGDSVKLADIIVRNTQIQKADLVGSRPTIFQL